MDKSDEIKDLFCALSKAQGAMKGASKTTENTFFTSKYADIASVWEAIRSPLSANGLSIIQLPGLEEDGKVKCETILAHDSGQFISSIMSMAPVKSTPQGMGSCLTYIRRYSLMAIVGISPEDDDGNDASGQTKIKDEKPKKDNKVNQADKRSPFVEFLERMGKAKDCLGEKVYYKFLIEMTGRNGEVMSYKHANQITNPDQQEKAYKGLLALAGVKK